MSASSIVVRMASELPDPGNPTFVTLCGMFGMFAGALMGRVRRCAEERASQMTTDGFIAGFGIGFACWIVALAIDRL